MELDGDLINNYNNNNMSYFGQLSQNIVVSTKNSTSTNITSAPTHFGSTAWYWCGQEESTLTVLLLQMSLHTDKNTTVYIDQSPGLVTQTGSVTTNGSITLTGSGTTFSNYKVGESILVSGETTRTIATIVSNTSLTVSSAFSTTAGSLGFQTYMWDITDSFSYNTIKNNFGINVTAINSFFRVRLVLEATTATTYLRLQAVLCPIGNALPRALDEHGNLKVSVEAITDRFGNNAMVSPMKDMRVIESVKLVGATFGTSVDTNFWTVTNTGTGSSSTVNGVWTGISGTSNNGIAKIVSVRLSRFQFGQPLLLRAYGRVVTITAANNTAYLGSFSETGGVPQEGVAFSIDPSGTFGVNCFKGGVANTVLNGSFNGEVSTFVESGVAHAYEIIYFTASAAFYIDGILIHTFRPTTTTLYNTLNLPICSMTVNSASGVISRTIEVWNAVIMKMGKLDNQTTSKYISTAVTAQIAKLGSGKLKAIVNGDNVGTVIFYDAVTATNIIASLDLTRVIGAINLDIPFFTGLCYTTTGALKLTMIYE